MEYNHVNLDKYCVTQEEYDDENACEEIKQLKTPDVLGCAMKTTKFILSDSTVLTGTINGKQSQFWCIKINNMFATVSKTSNCLCFGRKSYLEPYPMWMSTIINKLPYDVYCDAMTNWQTYHIHYEKYGNIYQ